MKVGGYTDNDVRLWTNSPVEQRRWRKTMRRLYAADSEIARDTEFGKAHGWGWTYYPDGSKTIDVERGRIRFPAGMFR